MKSTDKIAMKITEEEFNDILPILKENGLVEGDASKWTKDWCYLVNIREFNLKGVKLYYNTNQYIILPYNKELFLQYCGISIEETFEEYTNRVNPSLYTSFLAEYEARVLKELKNRKPICTTEDGVELFVGSEYWYVGKNTLQMHNRTIEVNETSNSSPNHYYVRFSTQEAAEKYVAQNTPQKTVDGFEITRGEEMWVVDTQFFKLHQSVGGHFKKDNGKYLLFKEKERAIRYICENKQCISLNDLANNCLNTPNNSINYSTEMAILGSALQIIKQRLGFE